MEGFTYKLDRFIPERKSIVRFATIHPPDGSEIVLSIPSYEEEPFFNIAKQVYNNLAYRKVLAEALFSYMPRSLENYYNSEETSAWPVKPRKKPLIGPPIITLDMPALSTDIAYNKIDWGGSDYIATVYEDEVHFWHPVRKSIPKNIENAGQCIKFSKDNNTIAIALNEPPSKCVVWDYMEAKKIDSFSCLHLNSAAYSIVPGQCSVTVISWTPNGTLVTGCSEGMIVKRDVNNFTSSNFGKLHKSKIVRIEFSSNYHFLASSGLDKNILVFNWPSMEKIIKLTHHEVPVIFWNLSWHPWKESHLAIASCDKLGLINVAQKSVDISQFQDRHKDYYIDGISFNPVSAELVVSFSAKEVHNNLNAVNLITVIKDFNVIIDEMRYHIGRTPYLLWNSTGTQLGTASSDENLCLWDFFGLKKNKKSRKALEFDTSRENDVRGSKDFLLVPF